jgi:hypothetical protein
LKCCGSDYGHARAEERGGEGYDEDHEYRVREPANQAAAIALLASVLQALDATPEDDVLDLLRASATCRDCRGKELPFAL